MSDRYEKNSEEIGEEMMGPGEEEKKDGGALREQTEQTEAPETVNPDPAPTAGAGDGPIGEEADVGPPAVPAQPQPVAVLQAQPRRPGHPRGEKPSPQGPQEHPTPPTPQFPYQRKDKSPSVENYCRRLENRSPLGSRPPPPIFGPEWPQTEAEQPGPSQLSETQTLAPTPIPEEEQEESPPAEQPEHPQEGEEKPPSQ